MAGSFVIEPGSPPKVAEMPDWHFWTRDIVGGTAEDQASFQSGTLSVQRMEKLATLGLIAREKLAALPVPGFQEWMCGLRRRLN